MNDRDLFKRFKNNFLQHFQHHRRQRRSYISPPTPPIPPRPFLYSASPSGVNSSSYFDSFDLMELPVTNTNHTLSHYHHNTTMQQQQLPPPPYPSGFYNNNVKLNDNNPCFRLRDDTVHYGGTGHGIDDDDRCNRENVVVVENCSQWDIPQFYVKSTTTAATNQIIKGYDQPIGNNRVLIEDHFDCRRWLGNSQVSLILVCVGWDIICLSV